jgi:hypothetical protein
MAKHVPGTLDSKRERINSCEARLWRVVLRQAILDAFAGPGRGGATVREADEARNWLTDGGADLVLACEGAGIDAGMVKSWAREMAAAGWPRHNFNLYRQIARGLESSIAAE